MIHPLVKIITVDGFFTEQQANDLCSAIYMLPHVDQEFGVEIENFNMLSPDADELFTSILGTNMQVNVDKSGIFRRPNNIIHFESFENIDEWIFAVALQTSTFNVFEHASGVVNALHGYNYNYKNLFEWNLQINYVLKPGQGVLFRPWLFHSFDNGQLQVFRLKEIP